MKNRTTKVISNDIRKEAEKGLTMSSKKQHNTCKPSKYMKKDRNTFVDV